MVEQNQHWAYLGNGLVVQGTVISTDGYDWVKFHWTAKKRDYDLLRWEVFDDPKAAARYALRKTAEAVSIAQTFAQRHGAL